MILPSNARGDDGVLVTLPSLLAYVPRPGRVVLTKKFHEGQLHLASSWRGTLRTLMEPASAPSHNLDNIELDVAELGYELRVVDFTDAAAVQASIRGAAVVLAATSYRQNQLAAWGKAQGVPVVYAAEYSLRTRWQIARAEQPSWPRRMWRNLWEARQERAQRRAIASSAGVQCNGTPTFDAYRSLAPTSLLFFDTRTRASMVTSAAALAARLQGLRAGGPLRLAFSGRVDVIKGAHLLPRLAQALVDRGVDFRLAVCGGGPAEAQLRKDLDALLGPVGARDRVDVKGVLDFRAALVPFIEREVDLVVLPHLQGDPSCTYLETYACGVPIAGFNNEAFAGLLARVDGGASAPLGDVEALADVIQALDRDRGRLARQSETVLAFARDHTFETEFDRRLDHLRRCRDAAQARAPHVQRATTRGHADAV